jgi:hypothetical protein
MMEESLGSKKQLVSDIASGESGKANDSNVEEETDLNGGSRRIPKRWKVSKTAYRKIKLQYYGSKRRMESLNTKRAALFKIIDTGKKEVARISKDNKEQTTAIIKLTAAQIRDEKRKLAELENDLAIAKNDFKQKEFDFLKGANTKRGNAKSQRIAYKQKQFSKKEAIIQTLINRAVLTGSQNDVLALRTLSGQNINKIKSSMLKIVRKQNGGGYPINNIPNKTVEKIINGLLNWVPAKTDEPFDIS